MNRRHTSGLLMTGLTALLLSVFLIAGASAQECLDYGDYNRWVLGDEEIQGPFCIVDDTFYSIGNGFQAYDVSDPTDFVLLGGSDIPGGSDVAVQGAQAFIADGGSLSIYDISDVSATTLIGSIDLSQTISDFVVQGHHVYIGGSGPGLCVLDKADPAFPVVVGEVELSRAPIDVEISNDYVFATDHENGFYAIDVSDPTNPVVADLFPTVGCWDSDIGSDGKAFLAGYHRIEVIDISDPTDLQFVTSCYLPRPTFKIVEDAGLVAVALDPGMMTVDVSDPQFPQVLDLYPTGLAGHGLAIKDGYVLMPKSEGLERIDTASPQVPVQQTVDSFVGKKLVTTADGLVLAYRNISSAQCPVDVYESTVDGALSLLGSSQLDGPLGRVIPYGQYTIHPKGNRLQIVDMSNPLDPWVVTDKEIPGVDTESWLDGDLLYCQRPYYFLKVIDVSDPFKPKVVAEIPDESNTYRPLAGVWDKKAYFIRRDYGDTDRTFLEIVDLSDLEVPVLLSSTELPHGYWRVELLDDWAYCYGSGEDLIVVDVHDTSVPRVVFDMTLPAGVGGVYRDGLRGYFMSASTAKTWVLDLCDLGAPVVRGVIDLQPVVAQERVSDLIVCGDRIHIQTYDFYVGSIYTCYRQCGSTVTTHSPDSSPTAFTGTMLAGAAPNPFNPETQISFTVSRQERVRLAVYDVRGHLVKVLADAVFAPGTQTIPWDGRNQQGSSASSGVYLVRLVGETNTSSLRVSLLK